MENILEAPQRLKPDEPEAALTWRCTGPEVHLQAPPHSSLLICKCAPYSTPT